MATKDARRIVSRGGSSTAAPDKQVTAAMRVGVVEIGSRATRLLVADVSDIKGLESVVTRVEDTRLMECIALSEDATRHELEIIANIVSRFREQAAKAGAARSFVFATEAIRQVAATTIFAKSPLAPLINEILDARAEAECSLIAGLMSLKGAKLPGNTVLVIDQGAGSMELAVGKCGPPVKLVDFSSVKLGGNVLLKTLRDNHLNIDALRNAVLPIVEKCALPTTNVDHVVIQGTVATKCAWLVERKDKRERYDLRRVNGKKLKTSVLNVLVTTIEKFSRSQWTEFQDFVNPGERGGDAGERVASGVIPLLHLLRRLKKDEFIVSGYGSRHGMCWRLAGKSSPSATEPK